MNTKSLVGWGMFAAGLAAMVWLWRTRGNGSVPATATAPASGTGQLNGLQVGNVGPTVTEDSSADVLAVALDYAAAINRGCWSFVYNDITGSNIGGIWTNSLQPLTQVRLPIGYTPTPICGSP